jgi:hypothetical protein
VKKKTALVLAALSLSSMMSSFASADLPPPTGQKQVGWSLTVKGITAADRVLFAYPCGHSDGAPMAEHQKIEDGKPISAGRRGGSCAIYSIDKAKYEEWAKSYKPQMGSSDPELEKLAAQSTKCTGATPSPNFYLASTDKRTVIEDVMKVTGLDATKCTLEVVPASLPPATTGNAAPTSTSSSSSGSGSPAPAAKSGCAFAPSSSSRAGAGAGAGVILLGLVALLARRRR